MDNELQTYLIQPIGDSPKPMVCIQTQSSLYEIEVGNNQRVDDIMKYMSQSDYPKFLHIESVIIYDAIVAVWGEKVID